MNILLLLIGILLGVGLLTWGAVQLNRRRRGALGLLVGGILTMVAGVTASAIVGDAASSGVISSKPGIPRAQEFGITTPSNLEQLDAQDFLIEGFGVAGQSFELLQNNASVSTVTVGADNTWSYNVSQPKPGDYAFSLRGAKIPADFLPVTVNVAENRPEASNAKCPCALRVEALAPNATIALMQGNTVISSQTGPVFVFTKLQAGNYGLKVDAPGFQPYRTSSDKFLTPANKNISVFLNK